MQHEHVRIIVRDADLSGTEAVPARQWSRGVWEVLKSPLYATDVAAGDIIRPLDPEHGTFEIVRRGGNVSVQFFLATDQADSVEFTLTVVEYFRKKLTPLNGRVDAQTEGLVVCTLPVSNGFDMIEYTFSEAVREFPHSQWQYGNVYDSKTGKPIGWWE